MEVSDKICQEVRGFIDEFQKDGFRSPNLYDKFYELVKDEAKIYAFCDEFLRRIPSSATIFNDALSYLNLEDFAALIKTAVEILQVEFDSANAQKRQCKFNENAEKVIAKASLECEWLLHPYLEQIYKLKPNEGTYYENYPWRNLSFENAQIYRDMLVFGGADTGKLFECLVATGDERNVKFAYEYALANDIFEKKDGAAEYLAWYLQDFRFMLECGQIKSYYSNSVSHIIFPKGYFTAQRHIWLRKDLHPTWNLPAGNERYKFGGVLEDDENDPLCHIITFEGLPVGLGVTGLKSLTLGAHLNQINEGGLCFYRHDEQGYPHLIGERAQIRCAVDEPIAPCEVSLAVTPKRWQKQDWGMANSRENLFRIGGEPCWIQSADVPTCPVSGKKMRFLMQLDSELGCTDGGEMLFGSGGICYVFWCDESKTSAFFMQCT